ncbi:MAG: CTP-dependent riboflavin kinase [Thermoplasmatales archaeon]|nr:CTP-dependent riboflavin kinase [Thermoplasmatales archaeon]
MKGIVCSGKGEGKKYIAMDEYKKQIEEKFNFSPYEGTLNLELSKEIFDDLKNIEGINLRGFKKGNKFFGDVKSFPVEIDGRKCALLLPAMSKHSSVVEIVCGEKFRNGLRDGDDVFFFFEPFEKKGVDASFFALPHCGMEESRITIYYDSPFEEGRRDLFCEENREDAYLKRFIGRDAASMIFEGEGKEEYKKLFEWIKRKGYSIISPLRKIKYSCLNEWQIEIKIKRE